jgi:hypothetical protein
MPRSQNALESALRVLARRGVSAVFVLALLAVRADAKDPTVLEIFTRTAGTHGTGGDAPPPKRTRIDVATLTPVVVEMNDVQAETKRTFRGVRLSTVLAKAGVAVGDRALLHFENGMVIPVSLDKDRKPTIDPLIALAYRTDSESFSTAFPTVAKRAEVTLDPRPLTFTWNKVVVETPALDSLKDPSGEAFTPWRYIDSLKRIEVVNGASYDAQFSTTKSDPRVVTGAKIYLQSCQYCHGVRDSGATYGWDFMLPFALHTHRKPKDLMNHVSVAKANALEKGLMMPTQKNLTQEEIEALWIWSFALAKDEGLKPYTP